MNCTECKLSTDIDRCKDLFTCTKTDERLLISGTAICDYFDKVADDEEFDEGSGTLSEEHIQPTITYRVYTDSEGKELVTIEGE